MNYRDTWATDNEGNRFLFTVEMQRQLAAAGLPVEPTSLAQMPTTAPSKPSSSAPHRETSQPPAPESRPAPIRKSKSETITGPDSIQIDPMTGKYIGRVKWYNLRKGYGFILRGAGEEIFFHRSNSMNNPDEFQDGQWILYDVEETEKGPEATDVEAYDGPSAE